MLAFRCTRALIIWCVLFGVLAALIARYDLLPTLDADTSYLAGLYERTKTSVAYQAMLVGFFGCTAYAFALLATLSGWIKHSVTGRPNWRETLARPMVGLSNFTPSSSGWSKSKDLILAMSSAPIRDAAVIFPAVGFIGTVIGVSIAIGALIGLVASVILTVLLYLIGTKQALLTAFHDTD